MARISTVLLLALYALGFFSPASPCAAAAADSFPRVAAYEIDATFFPERAALNATARVRFTPEATFGDRLVCHLHGELAVDSLRVDGQLVSVNQEKVFFGYDYSSIATRVEIELAEPVRDELIIAYSGWLNPSRVRSVSNYMRVDPDGVLLRAYGYSLWFPVFLADRSDEYTVDFPRVVIDVPAEFRAVFVGEHVGERVVAAADGDRRLSEWRAREVSLFYAQCTARRFEVQADGPNRVYHERDDTSAAMGTQILDFVGELAAAFARDYGEPDGAAGVHVMQMPKYGDIASGNVIGVAEDNWREFDRDLWGQRTVAHELVHAFVKTVVRRDDPLYSLAIEGFPSYFHLPVLAERLEPGTYATWIERTEEAYLRRRETGLGWRDQPLPPEKPLLALTAEDISEYKDAFVLNDRARLFFNWIRSLLGIDRFRAFTRDLFARASLDAESFENLVLDHVGEGASTDLYTWLHTTDYPERLQLQSLKRTAK